jgi:hypothetical protein
LSDFNERDCGSEAVRLVQELIAAKREEGYKFLKRWGDLVPEPKFISPLGPEWSFSRLQKLNGAEGMRTITVSFKRS